MGPLKPNLIEIEAIDNICIDYGGFEMPSSKPRPFCFGLNGYWICNCSIYLLQPTDPLIPIIITYCGQGLMVWPDWYLGYKCAISLPRQANSIELCNNFVDNLPCMQCAWVHITCNWHQKHLILTAEWNQIRMFECYRRILVYQLHITTSFCVKMDWRSNLFFLLFSWLCFVFIRISASIIMLFFLNELLC